MRTTTVTIAFGFAEYMKQQILPLFEADSSGNCNVESLIASNQGLGLIGKHGIAWFEPDEWTKFWKQLGLSDNTVFRDMEAAKVFSKYEVWEWNENAQIALEKLQNNTMIFEDIREQVPEVIDHPLIKDEWARRFLENDIPKRKKGKRKKYDLNVVELYNWACWCYVDENLNLEAACAKAVSEHLDLIHENWKKNKKDNFAENLKRIVFPKLDEHWALSQLSFRNSRGDG